MTSPRRVSAVRNAGKAEVALAYFRLERHNAACGGQHVAGGVWEP